MASITISSTYVTSSSKYDHVKAMLSKYGLESGMSLVGKLLPLNAISSQNSNNDNSQNCEFSIDSDITYGETTSSFGLPHNDHNYACALGLSPPSSPPYLQDFKYVLAIRNNAINDSNNKTFYINESSYVKSNNSAGVTTYLPYSDARPESMRMACQMKIVMPEHILDEKFLVDLEFGEDESEMEFRRQENLKIFVEPSSLLTDRPIIAGTEARSCSTRKSISNNTASAASRLFSQPPLSWINRSLPRSAYTKIHCICAMNNPDEAMVVCNKCGILQHFDCMVEPSSRIVQMPFYQCEVCLQRPVNNRRAQMIQTLKRRKEAVPAEWLHDSRLPQDGLQRDGKGARGSSQNFLMENEVMSSSSSGIVPDGVSPKGTSKRKQDFAKPLPPASTKTALDAVVKAKTSSTSLLPAEILKGRNPSPMSPTKRGKRMKMMALYAENMWKRASSMDSLTNPLGSAWQRDYATIDYNLYSDLVLQHVKEIRRVQTDVTYSSVPNFLLRKPLCRIILLDHNFKGLESTSRLIPQDVVIEYRGKVMMKDEYDILKDQMGDFNRYVYYYHNLDSNFTMAIDAAEYGTDARYIRRSCRANCKMKHCFVNDECHFYVIATQDISPNVELTLPFDFDYTSQPHSVNCACGTSRCPVQRWIRSVQTRRAMPNVDYSKYIKQQLEALSRPLYYVDPSGAGGSANNFPSLSSNSKKSGLIPIEKGTFDNDVKIE